MPFSNESGAVAALLQEFGKSRLIPIKGAIGVIDEAIDVRVLTGENAGARWTTDGVGAVRALEDRAFLGDAVDVGGGGHVLEPTSIS